MSESRDVVIVGGGLAGTLLFAALKHRHPRLRIALVEKNSTLGGNHTWCLHDSDIPTGARAWLTPLLSRSWDAHEVIFPDHRRSLPTAYHAIRSEDLHRKLLVQHPKDLHLGAEVTATARDPESGRWKIKTPAASFETMVAISCRGWLRLPAGTSEAGWQKFVGLDLELEEPHGLERVLLMDATVPQIDGFRFFYLLPWSERELLVEDTYYSNHAGLKSDRIRREILAYVEKRGWKVRAIKREEEGALPLHLEAPPADDALMPTIGAESNSFNAVTGYTLPATLRAVQSLVELHTLSHENVTATLARLRAGDRGQQAYMRLLNRMMFRAAKNESRYKILERFYRLPESTIQRFYAGSLSRTDQARILIGKPPVPLMAALRVLLPKKPTS